ncbi:MAG: hypothetical protein ACXVBE_07905, partial [Bdellovibrionota bacterium]
MRMITLTILGLSLLASAAHAEPSTIAIGIGASAPKTSAFKLKSGPSRNDGGEHLVLRLSSVKTVTDIKITGFSTGRKGKTLIRNAVAFNGTTQTVLEGLTKFAKVTMGNPTNYKNSVQVADGQFVEVAPNAVMGRLDLTVEGMTSSDASLLLEVTFADSVTAENFLLTRTGAKETAGSYLNETDYAKFTAAQLATVMKVAAEPSPDELAGTTFLCTSYSKLDPIRLDFKTRAYYTGPAGELLSKSDAEGLDDRWSQTVDGLTKVIEKKNGCGTFNMMHVVRRTGDGNLIAEVVLDLDGYIDLCTKAGYDTSATRELQMYSNFASVLNSKYVAGVYEF